MGCTLRTPLVSPGRNAWVFPHLLVNSAWVVLLVEEARRVMALSHLVGVKPLPGAIELGRGADGIVVEILDHPELVIKDMNHPFKLGRNRIALELRVLHAVWEATEGLGATRVFNSGTDEQERSWLVRERVFDVPPR